jgi:hypothetical protein
MRSLLCCLLLVLGATPAHSFDGERPGFVLGGGVGGAMSFVTQDLAGNRLDDFIRLGGAVDLRVGWGFSDAIAVFGSFRASWIRYDTQNVDASDVAHGVFGVGMVQHFDRGRSDWYSTGHLGLAFFDLLEEGVDTLTGFGFGGGVGREWRRGIAVELLAGWETTSTDIERADFGVSTITVRLQVVGTAY